MTGSMEARAVEAAKKVVAEGLKGKGTGQDSEPPRERGEKADNGTSHRGKNGKGAGAAVEKALQTPAIMRVSDLSAGQRRSRASGKGGAKSLPQFFGAAANLNSGTVLFPSL